jgi:hypothetical protein
VGKRDHLREVREGFEKWIKLVVYLGAVWVVLDILPHLPDELAKRIMDKMLGAIGL